MKFKNKKIFINKTETMSKHLKKFETQAQYETALPNLDLPNVSLIEEGYHVEFIPYSPAPTPVETRVVCIISAETTEEPTTFFDAYSYPQDSFSSMEIDGVEQSEILESYVFSTTGLHTLKFTLIDSNLIKQSAFYVDHYTTSPFISITIPDGVTTIEGSAFSGCEALSSITMPDSVTSIGNLAFLNCLALTNITIPSGVTNIDDGAFESCEVLYSITIPSGVTSIGETVFRYCYGLTNITVMATVPPSLGSYAFDDTNDCPIYVPAGSVEAYRAAEEWSEYASRIQAIPT